MRQLLAGLLILVMIAVTILHGLGMMTFSFNSLWIAGGAAWTAALLLFVDTTRILKIQVCAILAIGSVLIAIAAQQGATVDPDFVISSSTGLMTMIASVGFLRLVVLADVEQSTTLPVGRNAFLRTLVGLNIASSVINVSAPILIADRIHAQRPLQRFTAQTITRVFCGASNWSPFFGAMAVVLTYVTHAQLSWTMLAGLPFTLLGLTFVYVEARLRYKNEIDDFVGYPMQASGLRVPVLLIIIVLILASLLDDVSVLVNIALGALLVTVGVLSVRNGPLHACRQLGEHIVSSLPRIVNELCLFLAAGVLAAGISALISHGIFDNPFHVFDGITAALVLGIVVFCAFCGIHPIIMISSFSPMLLSLNPEPNLLAITYLLGWHLGTCSNPLSGTNLVFQGRYGIAAWRLALWNWPYAGVMWIFAALWLQLVAMVVSDVS